MLTPEEKLQIIKNSLQSGFKGSINDLINQTEQSALGVDKIATSKEEQEQGLRGQPPGTSMAFPNSSGNFNTRGMTTNINIKKLDNKGNIVRSYENVPPGIDNLPMGDKVGTVIETPAEYQEGGYKSNQRTTQGNQLSGELKAFLEDTQKRMKKDEENFQASRNNSKISKDRLTQVRNSIQIAQEGGARSEEDLERFMQDVKLHGFLEAKNYEAARNSRVGEKFMGYDENGLAIFSSHLMAHDPETFEAWPTLFQNDNGKWFQIFDDDLARQHAVLTKQLYKFDSLSKVEDFAVRGYWKNEKDLKDLKIYNDTYLQNLPFLKDTKGMPIEPRTSYSSKYGWGGKYENGGPSEDWIGELDDGGPLRMSSQSPRVDHIVNSNMDLNELIQKHFKTNKYNLDHMIKIMDYIGHHESGNDYVRKQDSYKNVEEPWDVNEDGKIEEGEVRTVKQRYDGPGRGRYQFENTKSAGGMTALNRTMNFFRNTPGFETNNAFVNLRAGWRGKLEGQPNAKQIDFTKLSSEEQDFVFIFNYLNGKESDKNALIALLTQKTSPTSDQIYEFWRTHHKRRSTKSSEKEKAGWLDRTKEIDLIYNPPPTEEEESE